MNGGEQRIKKHQHPQGILILASIAFIIAVYDLFTFIHITIFVKFFIELIPYLIFSILLFLLTFSLLKGLWWGWYLGMIFSVFGIVKGLFGIIGAPFSQLEIISNSVSKGAWAENTLLAFLLSLIIIVISTSALFYLRRREIKSYFKKSR
ncbi:hypothetical protein B6U70_03430 [Euryarchaeota archaeon ex4484_162]|nr:MAG: hypothetical protein B6U70_03430 [Euryarchaeota archaeon ex4484_162]